MNSLPFAANRQGTVVIECRWSERDGDIVGEFLLDGKPFVLTHIDSLTHSQAVVPHLPCVLPKDSPWLLQPLRDSWHIPGLRMIFRPADMTALAEIG